MNRLFLLVVSLLVASSACDKQKVTYNDIQVKLGSTLPITNSAGDVLFNYLDDLSVDVDFTTDTGDRGSATLLQESSNIVSGIVSGVNSTAKTLWCFTPGLDGPSGPVPVSANLSKDNPETSASFTGMAFSSTPISLSKTVISGLIKPLTSAVILDIFDSKGRAWPAITSVTMTAAGGTVLATGSSSVTFNCSNITVGKDDSPASLGAVVLPCSFTGTITVAGEGYSAVYTIGTELALQAGYVKHIEVNLARATVNGEEPKGFPLRLGIMGDSISTFQGMIPPNHRTYYTDPPGSGCDVTSWTQTYWGLLITQYWKCELDVNSSWSGSSVADGKEGDARTPFVDHSRLDLFKNPDTIILFGGTNDRPDKGIGLGEYSYDVPLSKMNTYKRFRDAYIYVIRYLQEKHPGVQFICIIGTHVEDEYAVSIENIANHYNLPCIDFRDDGKVTFWKTSHPDKAGHAYKAKKIYEETLHLFKD